MKKMMIGLGITGLALASPFYRYFLPQSLYINAQKIENIQDWHKFNKNNLESMVNIYQTDNVILSKNKNQVKNQLNDALININSEKYSTIWNNLIQEKNPLNRSLNLYQVWQDAFKQIEFISKTHKSGDLVNLDKIISDLGDKKFEGDCVDAVFFMLLNYNTFLSDEEIKSNNISYSFITVPKEKGRVFSKKQFSHVGLVINQGIENYFIDPRKNFEKKVKSAKKYNFFFYDDDISFSKIDGKSIKVIEGREVYNYHKYETQGINYSITDSNLKKIINGLSIHD